jgi:hypothetical protein
MSNSTSLPQFNTPSVSSWCFRETQSSLLTGGSPQSDSDGSFKHVTHKKMRLCSFSTVASEALEPLANLTSHAGPIFSTTDEGQMPKFNCSSKLREALSLFSPKSSMICKPKSGRSQSISEFDPPLELTSLGEEEKEKLVSEQLSSFESAEENFRHKCQKVIDTFDAMGAKQLNKASPELLQRIDQSITEVKGLVDEIRSSKIEPAQSRKDAQKTILPVFSLGKLFSVGLIFKRTGSVESNTASGVSLPLKLAKKGRAPKISPNMSTGPTVLMRDHKDINIFADSPVFNKPKLEDFSTVATSELMDLNIIRGYQSLIIPLKMVSHEHLQEQYQSFVKCPASYFDQFCCPVLQLFDAQLVVVIGLYGLKSHTQQLSVNLASLSLLQQILELMLTVFTTTSESKWMAFCHHYYSASLEQVADYRNDFLKLHLCKVSR